MAKSLKFKDKQVAVIGLGKEGLDLVRFLCKQKAQVVVLDRGSARQLGANYAEARKAGASFRLGVGYLKNLGDFDMVFRSPGIPLDLPEFKRLGRKVYLSSAIKLFMDLCPAKVVGVTGTKGKSTTTSLAYHLLKGTKKVYLAGNIGRPPLQLLSRLKKSDVVILELSSFQLEDMQTSPEIAVMLNVVPEHLDRHRTMARYLAAKSNIYRHQKKSDWLVVSSDFAITRAVAKKATGKIFPYSTKKILSKGLYLSKDEIVYRNVATGKRQTVAALNRVSLLGVHNLQNVLPAVAIALLNRVSVKQISKKLKTFKSLPHRLELVREKGSVIFVNDSLGTTPEAAAAAAEAFSYRNTALIIGGVYKGGDLDQLAKAAAKHGVVGVALIGKSTDKFAQAFKKHGAGVPVQIFKTFPQAIKGAYSKVRKTGGAVVLAPAAASFDMFKNAYQRGEEFKRLVKKI